MKAFRVLLPFVLAGIVIVFGISQYAARGAAETFRLEREALRREAVERAAVARGVGGPQGVEEARAVVRWWQDSMASLRNRYPKQAAVPEQAGAAGKDKDKDAAAEAWRRYTQDRLEALRTGYAPALSAVDQGLRLDVLAVRSGEHPETHERAIRIDFALWGAPRRIERESGPSERPAARVSVPIAFRQLAFRFVDAAGKTYGEMSGSGEPYLLLKDPERFSGELQPGIALGTWWVDPFPRESARVEVSVGLQVQGMTSAALSPAFRWELPVAEEWKLHPGEAFRAETREAPPEPEPARR
jgi:hypothetical protein